jgi:tRNA(fMet)-specific endonuclease VapC
VWAVGRALIDQLRRVGVRCRQEQRPKDAYEALREFLLALEVAAFDDQSAMTYGEVRASLAPAGKPIGPLDTLIGSHARRWM